MAEEITRAPPLAGVGCLQPILRKMDDLGSFGCISSCTQNQLRAQGVRSRAIVRTFTAATKSRSWELEALGEGHPPSPGYHRRGGAESFSCCLAQTSFLQLYLSVLSLREVLPHLRTSGPALARVGAAASRVAYFVHSVVSHSISTSRKSCGNENVRQTGHSPELAREKTVTSQAASNQKQLRQPCDRSVLRQGSRSRCCEAFFQRPVMTRSPLPPSFFQFSRSMFSLCEGPAKFEDARPKSFRRTKRLTCPPQCSAFS